MFFTKIMKTKYAVRTIPWVQRNARTESLGFKSKAIRRKELKTIRAEIDKIENRTSIEKTLHNSNLILWKDKTFDKPFVRITKKKERRHRLPTSHMKKGHLYWSDTHQKGKELQWATSPTNLTPSMKQTTSLKTTETHTRRNRECEETCNYLKKWINK